MKVIEKVSIHRFRSISDVSIETGEITIFSGINNSGKSNVLRALNLFFSGDSSFGQQYDFDIDYNKAFTGQAGGRRAIKVELHFGPQGKSALSSPFSISKTFFLGQSTPMLEYKSTDNDVQESIDDKDGNITRQFTRFLNKMEYFYVPAVRDKRYVRNLFLHFEKLIEHNSGDDFKDKMGDLSKVLQQNSRDISKDFEQFIGLPTQAELSSKITDILGTVEVNVKTGIQVLRRKKGNSKWEDVYVNLFSSGDGILMSYLAYFLAHVCKKISNKIFIWGFEEPENSLEYSKVQKMAADFFNDFRTNSQIFMTTHSPAFIKLKERSGVKFFRVYINPADPKQASNIRTLNEIKEKQLTLFDSGNIDDPEYQKLREELNLIEFANEIEEAVKRVAKTESELIAQKTRYKEEYEKIIATRPKNIFICEDSDSKAIKLWEKWIKMFDIVDVKVLSSKGAQNVLVETGIKYQKGLDDSYKPKVFRQLDRDGFTDEQIKIIENDIKGKSKTINYKLLFLPVHEIENFAVLAHKTAFTDEFWTKNASKIIDSFELTAADNAKIFDKRFDYTKKEFRGSNGNYTQVMQTMRTAAFENWRKFFPGKEMAKLRRNFSPIKNLSELEKKSLPKELLEYMQKVKEFFESEDER